MASMKNMKTLSLIMASAALISACTPTQSSRGNMVEDFRMREITPGISTRTNVLKSLGSPTTKAPFDENTWYYLGQRMEKHGIFDPEVTEEKVVIVTFNDEGIVQTMEERGANRQDVPLVDRKTPTGGNDVSLAEQILGNVGRFNKSGGNAATTAGGI